MKEGTADEQSLLFCPEEKKTWVQDSPGDHTFAEDASIAQSRSKLAGASSASV